MSLSFKPSHLVLLRKASVLLARLQGTGLPRLSAWLQRYFQSRWRGGKVEVRDFHGRFRVSLDINEHMGSKAFWFGAYSGDDIALLKSLLRPGDTLIDVGANMGEWTLAAAGQVGPTGKVIAFEPTEHGLARLRRHVGWNALEDRVDIIAQAVSDRIGTLNPMPSRRVRTNVTTAS